MDTLAKLELLGSSSKYDICCASSRTWEKALQKTMGRNRNQGVPNSPIYPAFLASGRCIPLFKVLQTNVCEKDCSYCVNRKSRDVPRITLQPEELAKTFLSYYTRGIAKGLFLSSGVYPTADQAMERMIQTVEILRYKYLFKGYIHLKILPGTSYPLVDTATKLASRSSINLEAPNPDRLSHIALEKDFKSDLITRINWLHSLQEQGRLSAGVTTQFVVGASDESDLELLKTTTWLYQKRNLRRVYFSAFQPVADTPLSTHPNTNAMREHRLYQSDFLLRQYRFTVDELSFDLTNNLPLDADPKFIWATHHPELFPIEVNTADYEMLLRVPGIGPRSAKRLVTQRKSFSINEISQLKEIGVVTKRAKDFVLLNGKKATPDTSKNPPQVQQLEFWDEI